MGLNYLGKKLELGEMSYGIGSRLGQQNSQQNQPHTKFGISDCQTADDRDRLLRAAHFSLHCYLPSVLTPT